VVRKERGQAHLGAEEMDGARLPIVLAEDGAALSLAWWNFEIGIRDNRFATCLTSRKHSIKCLNVPYLSDHKQRRKDDIYRQPVRVGKALARSKGLEILELVSQSERSLEERAAETAMSAANTSRHVPALAFTQLGETIEEDVLLFTASRTCWFPFFFRSLPSISGITSEQDHGPVLPGPFLRVGSRGRSVAIAPRIPGLSLGGWRCRLARTGLFCGFQPLHYR